MRLRAYPTLTSSARFGLVPQHWREVSLRHVLQFSTGWTPPTGDDAAYVGERPWANISDLGPRDLYDTAKHISDEAVTAAGIDVSDAGSLLFSFKLSIGQVSFAQTAMYTNEAIATFRRSSTMSLAYCYYALPHFLPLNAAENIYGAKLLNQRLIQSAPLLVPPLKEQETIAAFLDRETARIDALIAEKERLIALLQEKRKAVISHAVTKALDPNVPMKDSGVEWIGEVPAHWKTRRLKDVVSGFVSGGTPDTDHEDYWTDEDQGIPWVTIGDMSGGDVVVRTEKYITDNARQDRRLQFVEPGMLLLSMYASLGKATPVGTKAVINQALLGIAPDIESIDGRFLLWWLRHIEPLHAQTANSNTQANLNAQKVRNIPVPVPPLDEQRTTADLIEKSDERFRVAAEASAQAVHLLRERRTALITAAVTGQIDVRGLVETAN